MTRRPPHPTLALALSLTAPAALAQQSPAQPTTYVTVEGDTCVRIARRFYGDSRGTVFIHAANPTMGPPPHRLRAGTRLTIPPRTARASVPDALLTAVHNAVEVARPDTSRGRPNDPLFRGNHVSTAERSTAEVTFVDETQLQLLERTMVVILGETSSRVRRSASAGDTVLERGSLMAYLAGLDRARNGPGAPAPSLRTEAGRVTVERAPEGAATRVEVDEARRTTVSVYRGRSRVEGGRRQRVAVPQGYGVRATRGERIPAPRLLPLAPAWERAPVAVVLTEAESVTLSADVRAGSPAAAQAPPTPARWRVEVAADARFNELAADQQAEASRSHLEVPSVTPGTWHMRVSAIDGERFQGPPSEVATVRVARVSLGTTRVVDGARRAPLTLTPGIFCGLDGASLTEVTGPLEVDRLRAHTLRCAADASGAGTTEFAIAAERLGPLRLEAELARSDGAARSATARVRVRDAAGLPVRRDELAVTSPSAGVTLGRATPVADAPGDWELPVTWQPGAAELALQVAVDDERADAAPLALPAAPPPPAVEPERWHHRLALRLEGGVGYMLSDYQSNADRGRADFQGNAPALSLGFGGRGALGVALLRPRGGYGGPALALELGGGYWRFPGGAATTLASGHVAYGQAFAGLRVEPFAWRARLYLDAHAGAVFTGDATLLGVDVGLGVDVPVAGALLLGPFARYSHVVEPGDAYFNEDARVIAGGLSITLRAPPPSP